MGYCHLCPKIEGLEPEYRYSDFNILSKTDLKSIEKNEYLNGVLVFLNNNLGTIGGYSVFFISEKNLNSLSR